MRKHLQHPLVLIVLDGWGYRQDKDANAIDAAKKPYWDQLWDCHPHALLIASGRQVGLPQNQMGNSEVGHLTIGAGRTINQDLTKIDVEIEEGTFNSKPAILAAFQKVKTNGKALHLMGLLSPGGVHSHENHLIALLDIAKSCELEHVYIHAFLDGRDTPPRSAHQSLLKIIAHCNKIQCGKIVSLMGRYFAMDRDRRWERTELAYHLLTSGLSEYKYDNALMALDAAYHRDENDEFVTPSLIATDDASDSRIQNGDTVFFFNFRSDRARQLTRVFVDEKFSEFPRPILKLENFLCMTEYDPLFKADVIYPQENLRNIFGAYISEQGYTQLRIAETEKYAHVTFFFNGGVETPYPNEDRILIPSPKVPTYDLQPEMSAILLTDEIIQQIKNKKYDVIICNFANPDMLGHTGNFAATVQGIEVINDCLSRIIESLKEVGGEAIITADHGNAELMFDKNTGQPHTAHTLELVPFIYVGRKSKITLPEGLLSDIAPTMLYLMGLAQPSDMTGQSLLELI